MFSVKELRRWKQGRVQESMKHGTDMNGYRQGCLNFVRDFHDALGVTFGVDGPGLHKREDGVPYKMPGSWSPSQFSIRHVAEACMGHEAVEEYFHPSGGFNFGSGMRVLEAAVDPGSFVDINTFNLATSGLVNAEIMDRFSNPQYIGRNLVKIAPTQMNGHKRIAVARIAPVSAAAKGRFPGEPHAEIGLTDQYQTTPITVEQALKCKVTREAVFFDLTGQVLETAGEVGDELAYGMEKSIADSILGVSASYNLNGTAYNTYQTASPYINDFSNPFTDWTSLDASRQLFIGMTDPVTGREIQVNGLTILVMPAKEVLMRQQLYGANVMLGSQLNSNFPSAWTMANQPADTMGKLPGITMAGGTYQLVPLTAIWYNRATAADGLALSAANAQKYWWVGDFAKAVQWDENWPATPWSATADELTMKDQGLVAVYGCNYRGVAFVREPRYSVRSKN